MENRQTRIWPAFEVSSDTISNGGTVEFKTYLTFDPPLNSPTDAKKLVNGFEVRFDSSGILDPHKDNHRHLTLTDHQGDTAYGTFSIFYPETDSLPNFFEHYWTISALVNFTTNSEHSVDTTYTNEQKIIVERTSSNMR